MMIGIGIVIFAFLSVPLFTLFGAASILLFLDMPEGSWASAAIDVFSAKFAENPTLMTIPLFTFAGYLLAESGTPKRLVMLSRSWFGWMPGSLAVVCLMASAFFTTFTGGSGITIVAVGGLLLPAMIQEKYPEDFSIGLVTTAGSLGLLFPPSVPLILYGIIANLVIDKLLVAGIIPGIVVCIVLGIYAAIVGGKAGVKTTKFVWSEAWKSFWIAKWEILIPIVLVGGMALGFLRIHEASAFTAVYVLFIEVFIYRDISIRKDLPRVVVESMTLVGAILVIMATAIGFTSWMIQDEIPMKLLDWMEAMFHSKYSFLLVLNLFLFIVGMLMDIFTAIVVVVPLILPMAAAYGIDPYHLAIIFLLNIEIGYLTPPVGINLFISSIRFGKSIMYLYRTVLPFIGVMIVALMIVTYVPIITTWLPDKLQVGAEEDLVNMRNDAMNMGAGEPEMGEEMQGAGLDDLLGGDADAGVEAEPAEEAKPEGAEVKPEEGAEPAPAKPAK